MHEQEASNLLSLNKTHLLFQPASASGDTDNINVAIVTRLDEHVLLLYEGEEP